MIQRYTARPAIGDLSGYCCVRLVYRGGSLARAVVPVAPEAKEVHLWSIKRTCYFVDVTPLFFSNAKQTNVCDTDDDFELYVRTRIIPQ